MPTDMCSCPPSRSSVFLVGTLVDAMSQPVAGARLGFDGSPPDRAWPPNFGANPIGPTGASGAFSGLIFSHVSPGMQVLRAAVVRTAGADTVRIDLWLVPFRHERDVPDTVRFTIRLP